MFLRSAAGCHSSKGHTLNQACSNFGYVVWAISTKFGPRKGSMKLSTQNED